jgi:hypothetical protein
MVASSQGDHGRAIELARYALELAFMPFTQCNALRSLTEAEVGAGMTEAARAHAAELADACRAGSNVHELAPALLLTASLDRLEGDHPGAEAVAHEALGVARRIGAHNRTIDALEVLAAIAADLGNTDEAARLLGAAEAARDRSGYCRDAFGRAETATSGRVSHGRGRLRSRDRPKAGC